LLGARLALKAQRLFEAEKALSKQDWLLCQSAVVTCLDFFPAVM